MTNNLKIAIIQSDVFWETPAKNLAHFEQLIIKLSTENPHLIILPEMFNTGFSMNPELLAEKIEDNTITWMQMLSKKHNVVIGGTIPVKENNKYYNRAVIIYPDNKILYYDKKHLFSLGEENKHYSPGENKTIFNVNGWKILPLICYDLRFPVWSKNKYENDTYEYDLILYPSNWPENRNYQWRHLLIARAIENQAFVVGVNRIGIDGRKISYSGNSLIINPVGSIIYDAKNKAVSRVFELSKEDLIKYRNHMTIGKDWDKFSIKN